MVIILMSGFLTIVSALERGVKEVTGINPVLAAWSLAIHYSRLVQRELAGVHTMTVRHLVPHCKLLSHDRSLTF